MQRTRVVAAFCAVALMIGLAVWLGGEHPSHAERPTAGASHEQQHDASPATDEWTGLSAAQGYVEQQYAAVGRLVQAQQAADIVAFVAAEDARQAAEAEAARQAALAAQQRQQAQRPAPAAGPSGGSTGSCGGATNGADQFIQRESGGNPNAYNPSGAWGCYQIMPGTWAGAGCDEFGSYGSASAAAQAQCASRLPMSAWAL